MAAVFYFSTMKHIIILIIIVQAFALQAQPAIKIAKLKYNGGGDWYANKTALPNLVEFCNKELGTTIQVEDEVAEAGSKDIYNYPYVYMTGHGNVVFSSDEALNLRNYLIGEMIFFAFSVTFYHPGSYHTKTTRQELT